MVGAELRIFHAYEPASTLLWVKDESGNLPLPPPINVDEFADELRAFCAPVFASSRQKVEVVLREGNPAKEIARQGTRRDAVLNVDR